MKCWIRWQVLWKVFSHWNSVFKIITNISSPITNFEPGDHTLFWPRPFFGSHTLSGNNKKLWFWANIGYLIPFLQYRMAKYRYPNSTECFPLCHYYNILLLWFFDHWPYLDHFSSIVAKNNLFGAKFSQLNLNIII